MNRRELLRGALLAIPAAHHSPARLDVPILRLVNKHATCSANQVRQFCSTIWNEAVQDFDRGGLPLCTVERTGGIRRYASGKPKFEGLERGRINVVLTDRVPLEWDNGRAVNGVATIYEGFHLCVIAMNYAHGHRVPFLAVNTVVHELLHILLQDIFTRRAGTVHAQGREARVDWHATRLWLFNDGAGIREPARAYLQRLSGGER